MVSRNRLIAQFLCLGCDFNDEAVIEKSLQLCETYEVNEEAFAEMWLEYTVTTSSDSNSELNLEPSLVSLMRMEACVLKGKIKNLFEEKPTVKKLFEEEPTVKKLFEEEPTDNENFWRDIYDLEDVNELLDDFDLDTDEPEISTGKRSRSPGAVEEPTTKMRAVELTEPSTSGFHLSKPIREAAVVKDKWSRFEPRSANSRGEEAVTSLMVDKFGTPHIPKEASYMFETSSKQGEILTFACRNFGKRLCNLWESKENSQIAYFRNVRRGGQGTCRTFGRITVLQCRSTMARTVLLESTQRSRHERAVRLVTLDLERVNEYSLFSGQMVAVEGMMFNDSVFAVNAIFCHGYATLPKCPTLSTALRVYVAAGPYTAYHSLDYQPLWNLLDCVKEEVPDILILIGPMVDVKHSTFDMQYEFTFQEVFDRTVTRVIKELEGTPTKLVLVASHCDAHHDPVYPTMEYIIPGANKLNSSTNFSLLPDPCTLTVDDLLIGVTSVDVIKDLACSEITNMKMKDRLGRLADHVLSQGSFYPFYPMPHKPVNINITNWHKYASLRVQPHILVVPSDIKQFTKVINDCLVLNPGRLFKGTFSKFEVPVVPAGEIWNGDRVICEIERFF